MTAPYLSPSFETIEARFWATDTIDSLFSAPANVKLPESILYQEPRPTHAFGRSNYFLTESATLMDMKTVYFNTTLIPYKPQTELRRHTSFLTSSSSSSSLDDSLQSTYTPSRHSFTPTSCDSASTHQRPQSSASLQLSRRTTLTRHLKRHWTVNTSTPSGVRRLFSSPRQLKERKAQAMWREKLHEYLIDTAFQVPAPRTDSPSLAFCIVSELIATEESYLGHLCVFKQMFMDPLMKTFRFMVRDLHPLSALLPQLIALSVSLSHLWFGGEPIGKAFCALEDEFKIYIYYAVHYAKAQKCMTRMEQKSTYQQWMHAVFQKKEAKRMVLGDYLIAPIQRVTRYCLLLKNLIKHTGDHDAGLERSLKYLTALVVVMNDCLL